MTHYYTPNGRAPEMVPYADPSRGNRPATLRDAKKLGWAPGVTDVIRVLNAPGLNEWRIAEAVKLTQSICKEHQHLLDLAPRALVEHVKACTDTTKRDIGTEIHQSIELAVQGKPHSNREITERVLEDLKKRYPGKVWLSEVACFRENPRAYGGTIDLVSDDHEVIVDVKTKEALGRNMQYDEHRMQLAAYAYALGSKETANLFVDYTGDVEIAVLSREQMEDGIEMFKHALHLWYLKAKFS